MHLSLKASSFLAVLVLVFTILGSTGVAAQDVPAEELQPGDLEGLRHAVVRAWSFDYSALFANATPGAEPAVPTGVFLVGATILEFDSSDNAQAALTRLDEETDAANQSTMGGESEVTEIDPGLGDSSIAYSGVEDLEGQEAETVIALVQQDTYLYFVVVAGSGEDIQALTVEFTTGLLERDGSGAGEFNEDGTSTGGLWDKYPAADDAVVSGLLPFDQVLYPEPEGTPAA